MENPRISIDRATGSFAIFDGWKIIGEFEKYTDENDALAQARARLAKLTTLEPEVVYPRITSMRITYSRPKKKKT